MKLSTSLMVPVTTAILMVLIGHAEDSLPLGPARPGVVHTHANPARCSEYIAMAQKVIQQFPSIPSSHQWVVVCSLDSWNFALRKAGGWGRTNSAFTNVDNDITLMNGAIFEEDERFYKQTILHEAGHVKCRCEDETKANTAARHLATVADLDGL
jgi:hypothetical protein